jgi:hypothetical protein
VSASTLRARFPPTDGHGSNDGIDGVVDTSRSDTSDGADGVRGTSNGTRDTSKKPDTARWQRHRQSRHRQPWRQLQLLQCCRQQQRY